MFNRDTCLCTCADSLARQACLDTGRAWSEESCSCSCTVSPGPACSVGLAWSPVTCTCAPEQLIALETEERRERSGPGLRETFLSWQMVTIIVLLLLIFLLIITIFALISKLQTAKRRIKTAKLQASAQLTAARQGSEPLYDPLYSKTNNTPKDVIVKTKGAKNPDKLYSEIYSQQRAAETGKLWENVLLTKTRKYPIAQTSLTTLLQEPALTRQPQGARGPGLTASHPAQASGLRPLNTPTPTSARITQVRRIFCKALSICIPCPPSLAENMSLLEACCI